MYSHKVFRVSLGEYRIIILVSTQVAQARDPKEINGRIRLIPNCHVVF